MNGELWGIGIHSKRFPSKDYTTYLHMSGSRKAVRHGEEALLDLQGGFFWPTEEIAKLWKRHATDKVKGYQFKEEEVRVELLERIRNARIVKVFPEENNV